MNQNGKLNVEKDLVVLVHESLKPSVHCTDAAKKSNMVNRRGVPEQWGTETCEKECKGEQEYILFLKLICFPNTFYGGVNIFLKVFSTGVHLTPPLKINFSSDLSHFKKKIFFFIKMFFLIKKMLETG